MFGCACLRSQLEVSLLAVRIPLPPEMPRSAVPGIRAKCWRDRRKILLEPHTRVRSELPAALAPGTKVCNMALIKTRVYACWEKSDSPDVYGSG